MRIELTREAAKNALETILSTLPALQALHSSLSGTPSAASASTRTATSHSESDTFSLPAASSAPHVPVTPANIAALIRQILFKCTMPDVSSRKLAGEYRAGMQLDSVMEDEPLRPMSQDGAQARYVEVDEVEVDEWVD